MLLMPPRVQVFKIMLCLMALKEASNTGSKFIGEKFVITVPKSLNSSELKIKERHGGVQVVKNGPLHPAFRPRSLKIK